MINLIDLLVTDLLVKCRVGFERLPADRVKMIQLAGIGYLVINRLGELFDGPLDRADDRLAFSRIGSSALMIRSQPFEIV